MGPIRYAFAKIKFGHEPALVMRIIPQQEPVRVSRVWLVRVGMRLTREIANYLKIDYDAAVKTSQVEQYIPMLQMIPLHEDRAAYVHDKYEHVIAKDQEQVYILPLPLAEISYFLNANPKRVKIYVVNNSKSLIYDAPNVPELLRDLLARYKGPNTNISVNFGISPKPLDAEQTAEN